MPRALIVRHHADAGAGWVGERLEQLGYDLATADLGDAAPAGRAELPAAGTYDVAVVLGASWSVNDVDDPASDTERWLRPELEWAADAVAHDVPVLGICFGAQVVARALGGTVTAMPATQLGWFDIAGDPATGLPAGTWAQYHGDTVSTVPAAADLLATDGFGTQAFRVGRTLAVQFHPEASADVLAGWAAAPASAAEVAATGVDVESLRAAGRAVQDDARTRCHALVDAWLALR